jgi:PTS system fructose-specific IIB component
MKIVAITACATGVAHTYMAAKALEKGAKELGHRIKVERQGAFGIENKITEKDVEIADVVILAIDKKGEELERFNGKVIHEVGVSAPIKDSKKVINDALKKLK